MAATRRSQRPANVKYYALNRQSEVDRVRLRQATTVEFLRDIRRVPCADCQGVFEPHQMDFDHRNPSYKSFRLTAGRAMLMSKPRLLDEIAKCDVVCANCHRVRTRASHRDRLQQLAPSEARSKYIARKRLRWRADGRLLDGLRYVPCADCDGRFPPCAMDFDHRDPSTKTSGVTRMVGRASAARILAEAAKCDIVCANCHRARSYRRRVAHSERE